MPVADFLLIVVASAFGGVVSAVAGGGSIFTFPALIELGIPPMIANATNNVGLFPANLAATWAYRRELAEVRGDWLSYVAVGAIGGLVGACLLLATGDAAFTALVPWLLLLATLLLAFGPAAVRRINESRLGGTFAPRTRRIAGFAVLFVASVYGGYFGSGLGIMLLGMMVLAGMNDFQRMNALKNLIGVVIVSLAIVAFIVTGTVHWPAAIAMCIGAAIGGYAGALAARRLDARHVRRFVIAAGIAVTLRYFLKQWT